MTTDYKAESTTAASRQRCSMIVFTNPLNGAPGVSFDEQRVTQIDDRSIVEYVGNLTAGFDPGADIPILDPETGKDTGKTVKQGELYAILFSLYFQVATKRDEEALKPPAPPVLPDVVVPPATVVG